MARSRIRGDGGPRVSRFERGDDGDSRGYLGGGGRHSLVAITLFDDHFWDVAGSADISASIEYPSLVPGCCTRTPALSQLRSRYDTGSSFPSSGIFQSFGPLWRTRRSSGFYFNATCGIGDSGYVPTCVTHIRFVHRTDCEARI